MAHKKLLKTLGVFIVLSVIILFTIIYMNVKTKKEGVAFGDPDWGILLEQIGDLLDPQRILTYEDMMDIINIVYNNNISSSTKNGIIQIEFNYTVFELVNESSVQKLKARIKETENYKMQDTIFDDEAKSTKLKKITLTNYYE